jgi:hypothetical protein
MAWRWKMTAYFLHVDFFDLRKTNGLWQVSITALTWGRGWGLLELRLTGGTTRKSNPMTGS